MHRSKLRHLLVASSSLAGRITRLTSTSRQSQTFSTPLRRLICNVQTTAPKWAKSGGLALEKGNRRCPAGAIWPWPNHLAHTRGPLAPISKFKCNSDWDIGYLQKKILSPMVPGLNKNCLVYTTQPKDDSSLAGLFRETGGWWGPHPRAPVPAPVTRRLCTWLSCLREE